MRDYIKQIRFSENQKECERFVRTPFFDLLLGKGLYATLQDVYKRQGVYKADGATDESLKVLGGRSVSYTHLKNVAASLVLPPQKLEKIKIKLCKKIIRYLSKYQSKIKDRSFMNYYREFCSVMDKRVMVSGDGEPYEAVVMGVDDDGGLDVYKRQGMEYFEGGNSSHLRVACWGLFERISDGKRFIVVNTHWDLTPEQRLSDARQQAAVMKKVLEKYDVPVFSTGDFNSNENSAEFNEYLNLTDFADSIAVAETVSAGTKGFHAVGSAPDGSQSQIIDLSLIHI